MASPPSRPPLRVRVAVDGSLNAVARHTRCSDATRAVLSSRGRASCSPSGSSPRGCCRTVCLIRSPAPSCPFTRTR
eukprot:2774532-Lingulodinium_polyedra.AAC.1